MSFADNIKRICALRGTSLTTLVKTVKHSSSFVTRINNGSLPTESEMVEMARILNCSVIDFFDDDHEFDNKTLKLTEDEIDIILAFRSMPRRRQHEFMVEIYGTDIETK